MDLTCPMCESQAFSLTLQGHKNHRAAPKGVWAVNCIYCDWGIKIKVGSK